MTKRLYHPKRYVKREGPPTLARHFIVTAPDGARVMDLPTLHSTQIDLLSPRSFFLGDYAAGWVRRFAVQGGGYCYRESVREVV